MSHIELDVDRCVGHALCNAQAPQVFDLDDDGYCVPLPRAQQDPPSKEGLAGVAACPERALSVVD
ncbi:ferredoxin [Gordonia rubripertincta]|uniref:ferredoxin n=1 Tax=Gordonia rubripertincta TaxID=36822 RepID=UPI000B8DB0F7|nr:ferredoxin [Gordonia rubripertincta]ASR03103.1 hypothetical protein GCWB2_11530 [Gordonia rubripertincta]